MTDAIDKAVRQARWNIEDCGGTDEEIDDQLRALASTVRDAALEEAAKDLDAKGFSLGPDAAASMWIAAMRVRALKSGATK